MNSPAKKINIIVPIFDDWSSIRENINSLKKFYANDYSVEVYYVNDCGPNSDAIENSIKNSISGLGNFHYARNEKNLGFVKNCNNAVNNVVKDKGLDILLLNSDTVVTPGFKEELLKVLYSDDDICAVSPRGNNATVWSVPMDGSLSHRPRRSYNQWLKLKNQLPEKYISPTIHGFCVAIRRNTIDKIGLFDEIYGKGYGEENDFSMRALEAGWKCAIANHAFVFHHGSRSFGNKDREKFSNKNSKILLQRYPQYNDLVSQYVANHQEPRIIRSYGLPYKIFRALVSAVEYGYVNGYINTARKITLIAKNRFIQKSHASSEPTIQVWSHEISRSGAPLVLIDIIRQWKNKNKMPDNIIFNYPQGSRAEPDLLSHLWHEGIKFHATNVLSTHFNKGDVVILNSTAQPPQLYEKVLSALESNIIQHLYFYIHEDDEKTTGSVVKYSKRISDLIEKDKITVYTPSTKSNTNWMRYFKSQKNIFSMPGHITSHSGMFKKKNESDFDDINFIIAGSREPRKGIVSVLNALMAVDRYHIQQNPKGYRKFTITIAGDDHNNDFYNRFIKNQSHYFDDRVKLLPSVSQDELYNIINEANLTVTFSIADSLSMVTFEGMSFGHPIIRSEASGQDEQLSIGRNGWLARTTNWLDLVDSIEDVLNKNKTPNSKLAKMSEESIKIAKKNHSSTYRILNDIERYTK